MGTRMDRIFVYGTLRPSLYPQRFPGRFGPSLKPATLTSGLKMYSLGRYPALVPDDGESRVVGETFELDDIKVYDAYEGYLPNGMGLYDRRKFDIVLDTGEKVEAWVYFMHALRFNQDIIDWAKEVPSGNWADAMPKQEAQ